MGKILLAGLCYFLAVFGAGAVLGTMRVLWLAPAVGARTAELIEMPFMLAVTVVAARWIVGRLEVPRRPGARLGMGAAALALVLLCEFTVVLYARGLTVERYFATFDPVSGTLYYALLVVFMLMPLLVRGRQ